MDLGKRPDWLRKRIFDSPGKKKIIELLEKKSLHTVCQSAKCPNLCECFDRGTATFMILGDTCTRNCGFCAVKKGEPLTIDNNESKRLAESVALLKLKHVVVTSVTRDDLPDGGASLFVDTIREIRNTSPSTTIEILTPDFKGDLSIIELFATHLPDIFNHNIETVPRLYGIRPGADYNRSLLLLKSFKERYPKVLTKSGIMVGLGENANEVKDVLVGLRNNLCDIVSIGQYLAPGKGHVQVSEYISPEQFKEYEKLAKELLFSQVFCGPFVRSSYLADTQIL